MARPVEVGGNQKQLRDCTVADVEELAGGAQPSSPIKARGVTQPGNYALLAQEMRREGAETVGDLGDDRVSKWETGLGLGYIGGADVLMQEAKRRAEQAGKAGEPVDTLA